MSLTKVLPFGPLVLGLLLTGLVVSNLEASDERDRLRSDQQTAGLLRSVALAADAELQAGADHLEALETFGPDSGVKVRISGLPGDTTAPASTATMDETAGMYVDADRRTALYIRPSTFLGTKVAIEVTADEGVLWQAGSDPAPYAIVGGVALSLALAGGALYLLRWLSRTVAERERAVAGRQTAISRFRTGFLHSPIGMVELDHRGFILAANPRFASQLGYMAEELEGLDILDVLDGEDRAAARAQLGSVLAGELDSGQAEHRYRSRNGAAVWVRESISALATEHGDRHALVQAEDISDERRARAELHRRALFDSLTGLPNKANLLARLNRAIESDRRPGDLVAVLFLDLDKFKEVNDTFGHDAGDLLLIQVSERLRRACRSSDTVARLGGDEFVIVCEGLADEQAAEDTVRRFVEVLRDPMYFHDQEIPVSASIGLVVNSERLAPEEILRQADSAMQRAKTSGRDQLVRYDMATTEPAERSEHPALTADELSEAIDCGQLCLYYQPIVRADDGAICGFEALVRWAHPLHGLLVPPQFLGLAEEHELLERLDAWVLREGMAAMRRWTERDARTSAWYLIFNVGPANFDDRGFAARVKSYLDHSGIDPTRIVLERNETWFMTQTAAAVLTTRELRALGVKISLDHFGTASASLGQMTSIEFDFLKIDRSFVRDAHAQTNDVLEAMKNMADALGLRTIVEGVETESELRVVHKSGIEFVQGFLVGRPLPESEIDFVGAAATSEVGGIA